MRKLLTVAAMAIASLAAASGANAQTATQNINLSANVASFCTINSITNAPDLNSTIPVTNGVVTTTTINHTIASVACNNAADVLATSLSGGVTMGGAPATGTTNIIDYTATASFGGASSVINTSSTLGAAGNEAGTTGTTANAATGNLTVAIVPAQPSLPLEPGNTYADVLQVTLTAH